MIHISLASSRSLVKSAWQTILKWIVEVTEKGVASPTGLPTVGPRAPTEKQGGPTAYDRQYRG